MKIAVVSGSRADAGPLSSVYQALQEYGHDCTFFDLSNYKPASDTRHAVAWVTSDVQRATCQSLHELDLIVILGDRFEILGVAVAAFLLGKPIAHLSGGDITEGSQDDSMRHAITKLSHLHFVTNDHSRSVVLQLGEEPWRVHNVGCPSLDGCFGDLYDRDTTMKELQVTGEYILVVYHPDTIGEQTSKDVDHIQEALRSWSLEAVFIGPNTDFGSSRINWKCFKTLPRKLFLSALKHASCMVGNSSSAFYEAPVFGTPCVNVGDRQKGRMGVGVYSVRAHSNDIIKGVEMALRTIRMPNATNFYGDGTAARKIAEILTHDISDITCLLRKKFNVLTEMGSYPQGPGVGEVSERTTGQVGFQDPAAESEGVGSWVWSGSSHNFPR